MRMEVGVGCVGMGWGQECGNARSWPLFLGPDGKHNTKSNAPRRERGKLRALTLLLSFPLPLLLSCTYQSRCRHDSENNGLDCTSLFILRTNPSYTSPLRHSTKRNACSSSVAGFMASGMCVGRLSCIPGSLLMGVGKVRSAAATPCSCPRAFVARGRARGGGWNGEG